MSAVAPRQRVKTSSVLRLAVAMRGGVSLAVWIGGALREIDRLQRPKSDPFVRSLLDLTVFKRAEIDILTGASAGGLNAALGGYAIARGHEMDLHDVWIKTADIDRLLESKDPTFRSSVLDGSYFLDQVRERIEAMAAHDPPEAEADGKPVEMFLAATVFGGLPVKERVDPLFSDRRSEAVFHFRHLADSSALSDLHDKNAPARVATAARSTASFPGAFEPVEVGTEVFRGELGLPNTEVVPDALRLLDGGVVDNIPVARAIRAAAAAPASDPIRRWVVFLHPNPDELGAGTPEADPAKVPSIPAVARDLLGGLGTETLLDDLAVLERHNREAEAQKVQRYSLCARVLNAPTFHPRGPGLGSVDAYCLYSLLDDPASMLPWAPIGREAPRSPIGDLDDDDRFSLRMELLEALRDLPDTVRPFARLVRLAHFTVEWIRWAELHGEYDFTAERLLAYDSLFVAKLIDAAVGGEFLAADDDDRLRALAEVLDAIERAPKLLRLVGLLGKGFENAEERPDALFVRLAPMSEARATLEALARGHLPSPAGPAAPSPALTVSEEMLRGLCEIGASVFLQTMGKPAMRSLFTLLTQAIDPDPSLQRIGACLMAIDDACAGLHRGRAIGVPQTLDYLRVSGAATSPLATPDVPLDPVPKFVGIQVEDGGWIDPDTKLSGNKLANFSAFISPLFRANDWMWGRMDAATEMVKLVLRPEYLRDVPVEELRDGVERLLTSPFGATAAVPDSVAGAAETVCRDLWTQHADAIEDEMHEARRSRDPRVLELTRQAVQTRWHLELLVKEMPKVLAQPVEPGGPSTATSVWKGAPAGHGAQSDASVAASKARLRRLMAAYERAPRRACELWGRRKTTALGVRVARQTARGLVPDDGVVAWLRRVGIAAPLFMVVTALLSRGAFLVAWNALVNVVLLPRLAPTARVVIGGLSVFLSVLFWLKFVRRKGRQRWRGRIGGVAASALMIVGLGYWHRWLFHAPDPFDGRRPWVIFSPWDWNVLWPAVLVAVASALAVVCLWVWAKRWVLVVAAVTVGLVMGSWVVLGAWRRPEDAGTFQRALGGLGSMWIPAVGLAIVFTVIAVRFRPEDRPRSAEEADGMPGATSPERPTEVRVHGVGGSPGPGLLGFEDPEQAPIVGRPAPGVVVRQRADGGQGIVQGFDWGSLNSDSRFQALWVFLLPFTLLNVAGWAAPRPTKGLHATLTLVIRFLVVLLGWVLTATVALWVADLLVGYLGYQWWPRALGAANGPVTFEPIGSWGVTFTSTVVRSIGVGLGAVLALAVFIIVSVVARNAKESSQEPRYNAEHFEADTGLSHPGFFDRRALWAASKIVHLLLAFGALTIVVVHAVNALRASAQPRRIDAGTTLVIVGGVQLFLLLLLGLVALIVRLMRREPGPGVAWAFAVMAFALTNAFFSGVMVWGTKYLSTHPSVEGEPGMIPGNDLAIVDAYFLVAVVWALIVVGLVLSRTHIRGVGVDCEPGDEIREEWGKRVRRAQGTARIIHKIDRLVVAFAAVFVAAGVGFGLGRAGVLEGKPPWDWRLEAPNQSGLAYTAAAWLLPAFVVFVMIRVRKAASDNRTRRFIGQVWDVLSFWPRRFHPFAVRPYSHIAVPALRKHIEARLETGPVVVSAHSQGSILAVAALSQLLELGRVGLVTYGSHVGTLYRRTFGAYFDEERIGQLHARLGGPDGERWQNLFRLTDPVGGPVLGEQADHCVPDPAPAAAQPDPFDPPLEHDREPWASLAIHSHYLNERAVKTCVREMTERLSQPTAVP